jgi:uncharacterized damage-inducible protein DinB
MKGREMADDVSTTQLFYENWGEFLGQVRDALVPLDSTQLGLRAAANERTVGEMAQHVVAARAYWFHDFMGEGGGEIAQYSAAEIVQGMDATWQFMFERLSTWTPEDMRHTFPHEWRGDHYDLTRSWVVWHVLEHDLMHAGEISLTLGMHGVPAPRP